MACFANYYTFAAVGHGRSDLEISGFGSWDFLPQGQAYRRSPYFEYMLVKTYLGSRAFTKLFFIIFITALFGPIII